MRILQYRCQHRVLIVAREKDRCSFVKCRSCGKVGPKKHSYGLALVAWIVCVADRSRAPTPEKCRAK
jgi:polyferredoxin